MKVDIEVTCKYAVRKTFDVPENLVEKLDFGYVEEASELSEFFADNLREEDAYEWEYIIELFEPMRTEYTIPFCCTTYLLAFWWLR